MRKYPLIAAVLTCQLLTCCSFFKDDQIVGDYHIIAVDSNEDTCLGYELGENSICIVAPKVIAYGTDKGHIFIHQLFQGNKDSSNYFIVPILPDNLTVYPDKSIIGPLDKSQFVLKIKKMKIKKVTFHKID